MDFGVLDLDFDELEPKVEIPAVDPDLKASCTDAADAPLPDSAHHEGSKAEEAATQSTEAELAQDPEVTENAPTAILLSEPEAKVDPPAEVAEPSALAIDVGFDEDDFEAVDPALAPPVTSATLAFDTILEENELDVSEDMSLESI